MTEEGMYYYERAGQQMGPVQQDQLLACGVKADTLVWQEGMVAWAPAATLPALISLFQPVPPPLPRSSALAQPVVKQDTGFVPQSVQTTPLPAVRKQVGEVPASQLPKPEEAIVRPQFSSGASRHKWWHYLLRAVAVLFILLLARACGVIIGRAITTTSPTLPTRLVTAVTALYPQARR